MATTSKKCKGTRCKSEYQDEKYGLGVRIHNKCAKGQRCTVCGEVSGSDEPAKASSEEPKKK